MAKKPPIDLETALAAAKAKLAGAQQVPLPQSSASSRVAKTSLSNVAKPKTASSKEDGALTLEKLAKAWAKTKNFPKTH